MLRFLFSLAVVFAGAATRMFAEPAPGQAGVAAVRFALASPATGSSGPWLEAEVQVDARPAAADPGRMLGPVHVTLELGCEVLAAAGNHVDYYRADADVVALAAGRSSVRFYLPPEIVRRDAMRGEPRYWRAATSVAGSASGSAPDRTSPALSRPETRRDFAARLAAAAPANDGVLQPQYLTPFAWEHPTATPTFVRREAAR